MVEWLEQVHTKITTYTGVKIQNTNWNEKKWDRIRRTDYVFQLVHFDIAAKLVSPTL